MRVIVTGSRNWTNTHAVGAELVILPPWSIVVHGGARGADECAEREAVKEGLRTEVFEADWKRYGKAAGAIRNQAMVDAGADLVLAFPLEGSRGTWDCVRRAEAAGIPVRIIRQTVDA